MSYGFAVAQSQRRRAEWERVFGTDRVPVLDVRPRRAEFRDGPAWVYDVAVGRLHQGQVDRLAAYVARRNRVAYEDAKALVRRHGLTIRAEGVVIEKPGTADAWGGVGRFAFMVGRAISNATTSASSMFGSEL